jgi:hypothetical protein
MEQGGDNQARHVVLTLESGISRLLRVVALPVPGEKVAKVAKSNGIARLRCCRRYPN